MVKWGDHQPPVGSRLPRTASVNGLRSPIKSVAYVSFRPVKDHRVGSDYQFEGGLTCYDNGITSYAVVLTGYLTCNVA